MTYLRLVRFALASDKLATAQTMAADLIPAIKEQPGCSGASFFGGGDDGECGIAVFWDSREQADAATEVVGPWLQAHVAGNVSAPPDIRLFPILSS